MTSRLDALIAYDQRLVEASELHPDCASKHVPPSCERPHRGIVLMLHGFTAGPWQFCELAQRLAENGLHSFLARLPGHGATARPTGVSAPAFTSQGFPKSRETQKFAQCAHDALSAVQDYAAAHSLDVFLVGFSAGGALATELLLQDNNNIKRAVLIAPLLFPQGVGRRFFFRALAKIPLAGRILDRVPFAWPNKATRHDGWVRPGHDRFHLGNVGALFDYVQTLRAQKRKWSTPCQFVLTETDDKIDSFACRDFARKKGFSLWWFSKHLKIPHAMLSSFENNNAESRELVTRVVLDFLLYGVGHNNT